MASIKEQREEIFNTVYGVKTFSGVLALFEKDYNSVKNKGLAKVQNLYKDYSYAIFFMYSPSSIRNNLVKFKNVIKKNGGKYQSNALEVFTIDAIYAPIKKKDLEVKKALKADIQKGTNDQTDPKVVIDQITAIKEQLEKKTYGIKPNQKENQVRAYMIMVMLGLATGRRFTEILSTLKISKNRAGVKFDGLLKGNSEAIEGFIIELEYKEVSKYLKELRSSIDTQGMTEQQINSKYAKVFNNAMKRLGFKNVKTLRQNYSVAGSQLFKREGESVTDTITRILGHKEVFVSALNYT